MQGVRGQGRKSLKQKTFQMHNIQEKLSEHNLT